MTEDEAKTKWCCGPKVVADALLSLHLMQQTPRKPNPENAIGLCIGSACMAWRGLPRQELETVYNSTERPDGDGWKPYSDNPKNCAWTRPNSLPIQGYCGLATGFHD